MSNSDPTDDALATIAKILDRPEPSREPAKTAAEPARSAVDSPVAMAIEADGYHKIGPGPLAAIRFKWMVRRGPDDQYFVDETIGEHSNPIVNGPMSSDAAVRLVDARESEARLRFEALRSAMSGRGSAESDLRQAG